MKPFASIDLTTNKKNDTVNGMEFCDKKPSEALTQALQKASDQADETLKKAKLPLALRIIQAICLYGWLLIAISILKSLSELGSIAEAYNNAAPLFWIAGIAFVVWLALKLLSVRQEKTVLNDEDSAQTLSRLEGASGAILSELSVPSNARETDILTFYYKEKNGKLKHIMKGTSAFNYLNLVFHAYADEENLYLTNLDGRHVFPKASLKAIRTVKQNVILATWNKEAPLDEGFYKQFKLQQNQYGCVIAKKYHILELERDGQVWGIYFPCYELPTFEILTGLKAE